MNGLLRPARGGVGRELSSSNSGSRLPALGAGSPVRFVVRGKFGPGVATKAPAAGCGWLRPSCENCEEAAELSSGWWWKAPHLQAPAKTNSHKTVVVFHHWEDHCAVDTENSFGKIWLVVYLFEIWHFFGSGWGLTSAGLCTPWLPSCAACSWDVSPSVANTGEYFVCIRGPIYCRVRPFRRVASGASGICPLPYRRPGTMSREGTKRPLASPCNAFSAMQRGGEARLLHRVTLFHPPRATCSFRWGGAAIYAGKHGAILVTHYSISAGLSSCVMGEGGQTTLLAPSKPPFAEEVLFLRLRILQHVHSFSSAHEKEEKLW